MHDGANLIFVSRGYRRGETVEKRWLVSAGPFLPGNGYGRMRSRGQEYN